VQATLSGLDIGSQGYQNVNAADQLGRRQAGDETEFDAIAAGAEQARKSPRAPARGLYRSGC
jgi:hypothetical protein